MPEVLFVLDAEKYAMVNPRFLGSMRVGIFLGSTTLPAIRVVVAIAPMNAQKMISLRSFVQNATESTAYIALLH